MSEPVVPLSYPTTGAPDARVMSPRSFVSYAKLIGLITFLSRLLGMARESIAAAFFGRSAVYSAFQLAFTIPNLFRKLLGEGALSAAFIPLYAQALKREREKNRDGDGFFSAETIEKERKNRDGDGFSSADFAVASVNLLCAICLALTILGEAVLALLVWLVPLPWDYLLAARLTMIMLPYVLLVCGTAFLGSILQVHHRFAAITFTAVVSNVCLIVAMIACAWRFDLREDIEQIRAVLWLSASVLIAGLVQIAMLVPSLRAVGFRFRLGLDFWTPAVRHMIRMTIPVALGAGVLQISVLLDKGLAFMLSEGPGREVLTLGAWTISLPMAEGATQRLNWAQFLYQFPLGVFATALATAIFPRLSADALDLGREQFRSVVRKGIEAALFIGLPASIGLIVVRYPAVRLLFERGSFSYEDTVLVARSTALYAAAIWAFSLMQILNRAYYALHDTTTPLILAGINLLINVIVEIPLLWTGLAEAGMAAGTLVAFTVQAIVMLIMLDRVVGGLELGRIGWGVGKMLIASLLMWLACAGVQQLPFYPRGDGNLVFASQLIMLMAVGGITYFGACTAMGMNLIRHIRPARDTTDR